jgi:hypothetical protein
MRVSERGLRPDNGDDRIHVGSEERRSRPSISRIPFLVNSDERGGREGKRAKRNQRGKETGAVKGKGAIMTDYLFGGMALWGGGPRWLAKWRALDWKEEHRGGAGGGGRGEGWFWLNQRRGIPRSLGRQTLSRLRRREPIRCLE